MNHRCSLEACHVGKDPELLCQCSWLELQGAVERRVVPHWLGKPCGQPAAHPHPGSRSAQGKLTFLKSVSVGFAPVRVFSIILPIQSLPLLPRPSRHHLRGRGRALTVSFGKIVPKCGRVLSTKVRGAQLSYVGCRAGALIVARAWEADSDRHQWAGH